jgi:hypothetical protein
MPRDYQHAQKAKLNEEFAASLDVSDPTCESWAVVAVFYSALHHVMVALIKGGNYCSDHKTRAEKIAKDPFLKHIAGQYDYLETLSKLARYEYAGLPPTPYRAAKANLEHVKRQVQRAITS